MGLELRARCVQRLRSDTRERTQLELLWGSGEELAVSEREQPGDIVRTCAFRLLCEHRGDEARRDWQTVLACLRACVLAAGRSFPMRM